MKIDRLIGILSILLQKDMTTAPELAEHFEVSRRTINRDVEALITAGIPIDTMQGKGGGHKHCKRLQDGSNDPDVQRYADDPRGTSKSRQC